MQQKQEEQQESKTATAVKEEPIPTLPSRPVSLMVGIPTTGSNDVEFTRDFAKFVTKMCPPSTALVFESRYGIAQTREVLVNTFLQSSATHLLFLDTDILPIEVHGVITLLNDTLSDPYKYIVSGIYYNSLYSGLAAWKDERALKYEDIIQNPDPLLEVDKVGMGYCMIRKDLFNLLVMEDRPLFYYKINEGNVMESEDFTFLKRLAAKYNIRPYIDYRVTALHIKRCKVDVRGGVQF